MGLLTLKPMTDVASKCCFCLRFAHYIVSRAGFRTLATLATSDNTLLLQWSNYNILLVIVNWQRQCLFDRNHTHNIIPYEVSYESYENLRLRQKPF